MGLSLTPVGKKKIRVPVHQSVRFELLNWERLILRKQVQVLVGENEVAEVDVSIDMSLREWKRLRKAIRKGRNRRKEKNRKRMSTIRRPPVNPSPFTAAVTARQDDEPVL
jgi:hypothetical protein